MAEPAATDRPRIENPYPLPLYLNQKYVFDVLSMMERGFSQLETVTERRGEQEDRRSRLSGDVGFKNVFGLLSVSFGGDRTRQERIEGSEEVASQRVHTPNSLFARMRERLFEEGLVQSFLVPDEPAATGSFVEVRMRLEKNPLVETLESLASVLRMAAIFEDRGSTGGRNSKQGQRRPKASETDQMLKQMTDLMTELNTGEVVDLIGTPVAERPPSVVLTLDTAYAIDSTLSDLIDGEYSVLGKVTRSVTEGVDESINLLRKTTLGRLNASLLDQLREPLVEIQQSGLDLPSFWPAPPSRVDSLSV